MRLRNRKTGEIGYLIVGRGSDHYVVANNEWYTCGKYDSLAELNDEWEDHEEQKYKYWYWINFEGVIEKTSSVTEYDTVKNMQEIDNYFDTREEAEKALEKLKAWKRLKDKGVKITGWEALCGDVCITTNLDILDVSTRESAILDLLFGGEE